MDAELLSMTAQMRNVVIVLNHRLARLEKTTSKLSRHYNRVAHTRALLAEAQGLQGLMLQDPDVWDDEPAIVPF